MKNYIITILMLTASNIFMTFAWYGHLKNHKHSFWFIVVLISWGIAFFEYLIQVPANRIGNEVMTVAQLKILQEIISLTIFIPFTVFFMNEKLTWDYLWASLCILGAVFFIFRSKFISIMEIN